MPTSCRERRVCMYPGSCLEAGTGCGQQQRATSQPCVHHRTLFAIGNLSCNRSFVEHIRNRTSHLCSRILCKAQLALCQWQFVFSMECVATRSKRSSLKTLPSLLRRHAVQIQTRGLAASRRRSRLPKPSATTLPPHAAAPMPRSNMSTPALSSFPTRTDWISPKVRDTSESLTHIHRKRQQEA